MKMISLSSTAVHDNIITTIVPHNLSKPRLRCEMVSKNIHTKLASVQN